MLKHLKAAVREATDLLAAAPIFNPEVDARVEIAGAGTNGSRVQVATDRFCESLFCGEVQFVKSRSGFDVANFGSPSQDLQLDRAVDQFPAFQQVIVRLPDFLLADRLVALILGWMYCKLNVASPVEREAKNHQADEREQGDKNISHGDLRARLSIRPLGLSDKGIV